MTVFIRGLLENVGSDINPLRLIRRIKDGLEIPGLKPAIIKILQASNLQVSLLEGAGKILNGDAIMLAQRLHRAQTGGVYAAGKLHRLVPLVGSIFLTFFFWVVYRGQPLPSVQRLCIQTDFVAEPSSNHLPLPPPRSRRLRTTGHRL